jgi:hypothetical protein
MMAGTGSDRPLQGLRVLVVVGVIARLTGRR